MKKNNNSSVGFTLIELMMVLAVSAILLSIGVPSFAQLITNNRVSTASNSLITDLNLARSEAIQSGYNTILCKSNNGKACNENSDWDQGWLLYLDKDSNQQFDINNDQIIQLHEAYDKNLNFIFRSASSIAFRPNGTINRQGRFCFYNHQNPDNSRAIIITNMGRIRSEVRNGENDCKG